MRLRIYIVKLYQIINKIDENYKGFVCTFVKESLKKLKRHLFLDVID
jgi:hypothetical protein